MASIIDLSDHKASLEFSANEANLLLRAIESRFGTPTKTGVELDETFYTFSGEEFTFHDAWDQPCLTSRSRSGSEILRVLAQDIEALARGSFGS